MPNGNDSGSGSSSSSSSAQHHDAPSVGFVPTMGALHAGHLDLVQRSLRENAYTVISIFVNPAQFAPNEDLASYPRTLPSDVQALIEAEQAQKGLGEIGALFVPNVQEMYPPLPGTSTPFTQNVQQQEGAFVTMHGSLASSLEGASRPAFFRGVATVVTKLFHAVEPTRVYFGQKDIQQALILRGMVSSLLFGAPGKEGFKVVETRRDQETGLALSSRNAYLSDEARRRWAPLLIRGLEEGRSAFDTAIAAGESAKEVERKVTSTALGKIDSLAKQAEQESGGRVRFEVDYVSLNCRYTLRPYAEAIAAEGPAAADGAVLSGAVALIEGQGEGKEARRTRLIDNLLLGKAEEEILGASSER
ncbi:Nucleotidylyl transferase [Jaminaea rosea]|uniref:Pantoate--beta-alanine ligase n=1 Tax=Jaminaea rosea TaxID=1569628 RepID=A0A316ULM8_9BASI|nr:Nucleotidylyl transferase [Jaminaea rosea]PWN26140.1 Nucleotidylyl transferase [Jaminaea rosea]